MVDEIIEMFVRKLNRHLHYSIKDSESSDILLQFLVTDA